MFSNFYCKITSKQEKRALCGQTNPKIGRNEMNRCCIDIYRFSRRHLSKNKSYHGYELELTLFSFCSSFVACCEPNEGRDKHFDPSPKWHLSSSFECFKCPETIFSLQTIFRLSSFRCAHSNNILDTRTKCYRQSATICPSHRFLNRSTFATHALYISLMKLHLKSSLRAIRLSMSIF